MRFRFSRIRATLSFHFVVFIAEDGEEKYRDSKRTFTTIVLLVKPFAL